MRRVALALALLVACKRKEPPPAARVSAPPASASVGIGPPLPPPWKPSFDTPPVGEEPLRLVAIARGTTRKVLSFGLYGKSIWISTNGSDALATADGPLEKIDDPLAGVPYRPANHDVKVVGFYPNLFVLRTEKKGVPRPSVFVARGPSRWQEVPLSPARRPVTFLAYGPRAVVVTGVHDETKNPDSYFSGEEVGTVLETVGPDGIVAPMPISALDRKFIAWDGAWDGTGISLIGAIAEETDLSYGPHWVPVGTYIFQLNNDGTTSTTKIQAKKAYHSIVPDFAIYRNSGFTTSEPERFYIVEDNERWRPNGATTFRVDSGGKTLLRSFSSNQNNYLSRSRFVGENLYTIQGHRPSERQSDPVTMQLLRVGPSGKTELIELPDACEPHEIVAGFEEDLWIQALCREGPAIFRRGGPAQTPLAL